MKNSILFVAALLFLFSCGTKKEVNKETEEVNKEQKAPTLVSAAVFQKWELTMVNGRAVMPNRPVYIDLTTNNKLSGFAGCNRLMGNYNIENGSQIQFDQVGTTRMACPEQEMNLETQVLEILNTVDNFTINEDKLMLNVGRRAPLAVFRKMSTNPVVNKQWTLKELNGNAVKMVDNQKQAQYFMLRSDGSFSGFGGCNNFNAQYELTGENRISFKENMAATLKACIDVKVNERSYFDVFKQADTYTIKGNTLKLSKGDGTPLAVFETSGS